MTTTVGLTADYDAELGDDMNLEHVRANRQRCAAGGGSVRLQGSMPA